MESVRLEGVEGMIGENYCGMTSGNLKGEDMSYEDRCGMREIEVKFLKGGKKGEEELIDRIKV